MENEFDVIILGTGLSQSIVAAALSKAGFKLAHLDTNAYYGSYNASLTLDELCQWADDQSQDERSPIFGLSRSTAPLPPQSRQYALSLSPSAIPSIGPLIVSLIGSGVSRYGSFRLLERVAIYRHGQIHAVPSGKEDVFKNREYSLLEKRRLMRFLMFAVGEFEQAPELAGKEDTPFIDFLTRSFSLKEDIAEVVAYALAHCTQRDDLTLPALLRTRKYLKSSGRYGSSSFLVGHYGGAGEISQGFCRAAAVSGAVYILGRKIVSITENDSPSAKGKYTLIGEDLPEELYSDLIISSPELLPLNLLAGAGVPAEGSSTGPAVVARCIAIIDQPISFTSSNPPPASDADEGVEEDTPAADGESELDTFVVVFPPKSLDGGAQAASVTALVTGAGSMSAPKGRWVIYLSMPTSEITDGSAEDVLRPYLSALLSSSSNPSPTGPNTPTLSFYMFYYEHLINHPAVTTASTTTETPSSPSLIISPNLVSPSMTEVGDEIARQAEALFHEAISKLKHSPRVLARHEQDGQSLFDIDIEGGLWPPQPPPPDEEEEEDGRGSMDEW